MVEREWAYQVRFARKGEAWRHGIHARIKWGLAPEFCRAISSMIEARMRLRGYGVGVVDDHNLEETRIGAIGADRLTDLFTQRLVTETRAAIRECHRIYRANMETLIRPA